MKVTGRIFAILCVFLTISAIVYGILSREWAGTTALALSAGLAFMIGFYLLFTDRRVDPAPEDNVDGEVSDGAGELGFFSPHSWWPLALAGSASIVAVGLVFAWWVLAVGVGLLGIAIVGFVFEYYRGQEV
jgi:hypothetical protein